MAKTSVVWRWDDEDKQTNPKNWQGLVHTEKIPSLTFGCVLVVVWSIAVGIVAVVIFGLFFANICDMIDVKRPPQTDPRQHRQRLK